MEKFKQDKKKFLICPWCPTDGPVTILIENCPHNPFKLMKKVRELETEVYKNNRAATILQDMADYFGGL
jgi:hypothetical protein